MNTLVLDRVSQDRGTGRRRHRVLHDISLIIEPGEIVLLEGPSGVGKSTLLGVAAGLLTPESGEVTVAGRRITGLSQAARRRHRAREVGFVFQRSNLVSGLTALENLQLMANLSGVPRSEGTARAVALLERVGLADLADRLPHELSGGEEQRVALARGLIHRPALVLADEPTSSLDSKAGGEVATLLASLARDAGTAVLVSTFDPRLIPYAGRRIGMLDGRLTDAPTVTSFPEETPP